MVCRCVGRPAGGAFCATDCPHDPVRIHAAGRLAARTPAGHFALVPIIPLYGHEALRTRLATAFQRGALPASLLFDGPRGVGKQRLALWVAQMLVCSAQPPAAIPCGQCQNCRYALALAHPDVHWFFPRPRLDSDATTPEVLADYTDALIERAKAGGLYAAPDGSQGIYVATVRTIVQLASVSPAMGPRKVFVIGDAERMVPQEGSEFAANALLKLLEEPPANTHIILTSSESGALLPTIRSRVVSVRVAPLPPNDVEAFLAHPAVAAALGRGRPSSSAADHAGLAEGAPGRLFGSNEREAAVAAARRMLESALSGDRAKSLRTAVGQGGSKARGAFSDALDELTALLAARARTAATRGDDHAALRTSQAIASVEQAKAMASGNISPALITATLLRDLGRMLA